MAVDEQNIQSIVSQVLTRLHNEGVLKSGGAVPASPAPVARIETAAPGGGHAAGVEGIFPDLDSAVNAAHKAQKALVELSLDTRRAMIAAMRAAVLSNLELLSRSAVEETGLGRVEDKINKNRLAATKTPGVEDIQPIAWTGDSGLTLIERAPWGVIGAIAPTTNPTETIICNAIGMIAAGNSVVFGPHPSAKNVTNLIIGMMNQAIASAGGPPNLICSVANPSIQQAQALMKHPGIRMLVVTGGPAVVAAAMNSGKKAICAGPGNPPAVVDETADIPQAAKHIYQGATLDNNIVCIAEKEIIAVASIADRLKEELKRCGAYELNAAQTEKLMKVILAKVNGPGVESDINKKWVGKDAHVILKEIGVEAPSTCRMVLCEVNRNHPLVWTEQLMPVMPLVRVRDIEEAIELARDVEHGYGHTSTIHSKNIDNMHKMARVMDTNIFVKNGPSYAGLGLGGEGPTSFTIAHPTGEGLTTAQHFTRIRRCVLKDVFRIV